MPNQQRPIGSLLVLGGARSGKSRYAQSLAEASGRHPVLIATAEALDTEMAGRIARHAAARDARWELVEEPVALATALLAQDQPGTQAQGQHEEGPAQQSEAGRAFPLASCHQCSGFLIEGGVVPGSALGAPAGADVGAGWTAFAGSGFCRAVSTLASGSSASTRRSTWSGTTP